MFMGNNEWRKYAIIYSVTMTFDIKIQVVFGFI